MVSATHENPPNVTSETWLKMQPDTELPCKPSQLHPLPLFRLPAQSCRSNWFEGRPRDEPSDEAMVRWHRKLHTEQHRESAWTNASSPKAPNLSDQCAPWTGSKPCEFPPWYERKVSPRPVGYYQRDAVDCVPGCRKVTAIEPKPGPWTWCCHSTRTINIHKQSSPDPSTLCEGKTCLTTLQHIRGPPLHSLTSQSHLPTGN